MSCGFSVFTPDYRSPHTLGEMLVYVLRTTRCNLHPLLVVSKLNCAVKQVVFHSLSFSPSLKEGRRWKVDVMKVDENYSLWWPSKTVSMEVCLCSLWGCVAFLPQFRRISTQVDPLGLQYCETQNAAATTSFFQVTLVLEQTHLT